MLNPLHWEKQPAVSKGCSLPSQLSHPLTLGIVAKECGALLGFVAEPCPGTCPQCLCRGCARYPLPQALPHRPSTQPELCFWFSHSENSVTICQVLRVIFAWWKCWPYCESNLTAFHSEVVRQWGEFTTHADKAASIMCENINNRGINAKQWDHLKESFPGIIKLSQAQ